MSLNKVNAIVLFPFVILRRQHMLDNMLLRNRMSIAILQQFEIGLTAVLIWSVTIVLGWKALIALPVYVIFVWLITILLWGKNIRRDRYHRCNIVGAWYWRPWFNWLIG